jgi:2-iminobutanoate/2-iminopropanoate deaminase
VKTLLRALALLILVSTGPTVAASPADPQYFPSPDPALAALPFSEAVRNGDLLFVSGQIGAAPGTLAVVPGGIDAEARQALQNVKAILERHGSSLDRVVKCTVFLADMKEWPAFNAIYRNFFRTNLPARSALGANGLALGARVEVECLAAAGSTPAPTPVAAERIPSVTLPPEIARVLTEYEAAWGAKNAAALARLFTEDGFVLAGRRPPVKGRAAIEAYYAGHGGPLALRAFAFSEQGTVGNIVGGYARKAGDPDDGKFTLTLRKGADGRWLIASDMDNGNEPTR